MVDPLPSYGRGRERPGRRYISFIHGDGLNDVVITGGVGLEITLCIFFCNEIVLLLKMVNLFVFIRFLGRNGTIDGQGEPWWNMWRDGTLKFTRPGLIEFKNSSNIVVSHVVLQNSPFWTLHPVYCRFTNLSLCKNYELEYAPWLLVIREYLFSYSDVVVHHVTILAPTDSPNTDGIDPGFIQFPLHLITSCYVSNHDLCAYSLPQIQALIFV